VYILFNTGLILMNHNTKWSTLTFTILVKNRIYTSSVVINKQNNFIVTDSQMLLRRCSAFFAILRSLLSCSAITWRLQCEHTHTILHKTNLKWRTWAVCKNSHYLWKLNSDTSTLSTNIYPAAMIFKLNWRVHNNFGMLFKTQKMFHTRFPIPYSDLILIQR